MAEDLFGNKVENNTFQIKELEEPLCFKKDAKPLSIITDLFNVYKKINEIIKYLKNKN